MKSDVLVIVDASIKSPIQINKILTDVKYKNNE
jgi:hypothetical protein